MFSEGLLFRSPLSHSWGIHSKSLGLIAWRVSVKSEFHNPRGVYLEFGTDVESVAPLAKGIVPALSLAACPGLDPVALLPLVSRCGLGDRETLDCMSDDLDSLPNTDAMQPKSVLFDFASLVYD